MNHWPASSSAAAAAVLEDEPLLAKRRMKTLSVREYLAKLETSHEPGLTNAQLMLRNDDLKPGGNLSLLVTINPPFCLELGGLSSWAADKDYQLWLSPPCVRIYRWFGRDIAEHRYSFFRRR